MGKVYGLIVSAGKETRFNGDKPKTLSLYNGKSFLDWNIESLSPHCDEVLVVVSNENKHWFKEYNTIVIDSGYGCGDAVMKALSSLNVEDNDECFVVWGDCLCRHAKALQIFGRGDNIAILIPCTWESSPYVCLSESLDGGIKVSFSKYGEVFGAGYHDLGVFYGNAKLMHNKLKEFAQKITFNGGYRHKHGNEMQFLDIFNETDIKGAILPTRIKSISFNSIEELNNL